MRQLANVVHSCRRGGFGGNGEVGFNLYFHHKKFRRLAKHHVYVELPIWVLCTVRWVADGAVEQPDSRSVMAYGLMERLFASPALGLPYGRLEGDEEGVPPPPALPFAAFFALAPSAD